MDANGREAEITSYGRFEACSGSCQNFRGRGLRTCLGHGTFSKFLCIGLLILLGIGSLHGAGIPEEPVAIGLEPQFVFDRYIVDNHWAIKYKREAVRRIFHQPEKHPANPVMTGDKPSYLWVVRDGDAGPFRMYYQANYPVSGEGIADENQEVLPDAKMKGRKFQTRIAYAESKDGVHWEKPDLNLFPWHRGTPNNVLIGRLDRPEMESCAPCLLEVPEKDRRGWRYLMMYRAKGRGIGDLNGIRVIGSRDGIHWDVASDTRIAQLHSDHPNTVCWDPTRAEYVLYCRAKHIYRAWGEDMLDTGASRRIARMHSRTLWTDWMEDSEPQTILIPDEADNETNFNFFYGMPTRYYSGIYWGFLEPFRMNDFIYTELAWSRDGIQFDRLPGRPKLIEYGPEGSWDDEMIFGSPSWVEVGDKWYLYYTGWDGPHGTPDRNGAVGLATVRKEGIISLRGPRGGGVVATRTIVWPGGDLVLNADASEGELKVRVSDARRKPIEGFDYPDCVPFSGDSVSHSVNWRGKELDSLKGEVIRLEIFLRDADLYTFRAGAGLLRSR